jgi:hypothetical protein
MTTMFKNHEAIQSLRGNYGQAGFKILKAPVQYSDKLWLKYFDGKNVYYRSDTGTPIAVHGKNYKGLQYSEMIDKTRDMLERCELDCTGIKESIEVSHNGAMCKVEYDLPATSFKTPDGDYGSAKVMALNSWNGVWSFVMSLGFQQWACLNSQVMIKNPAGLIKQKHSQRLDVNNGTKHIGKIAGILENEISLWHEMDGIHVTRNDILDAFGYVAFKDYDGDTQRVNDNLLDESNRKNKNLAYMYRQYYQVYRPRMGDTQWAVYNAITDWSTHYYEESLRNKTIKKSKNVIQFKARQVERATLGLQKWLKVA